MMQLGGLAPDFTLPGVVDDPIETGSESETDTNSMTKTTPNTSTTETTAGGTDNDSSSSLPYIYARETVKEGRDQVPFFLRDHVQSLEDEFIDELEDRLGTNVYKADAREVALKIAFETQVDEAVDRLRDWGYDR